MSMSEWAAEEVRIACQKENPDRKEGEWDYGCAIYESALKAYKSLCEDGHSGFSFSMAKQVLNRLMDGKPLTPIEDVPETWNKVGHDDEEGCTDYQCKRMYSLFKRVYDDGQIIYSDNNRIICYDINNPEDSEDSYSSGLIYNYFNNKFPLKLPYYPGKPIKVYAEDFLFDPKNGDFDTIGIIKATFPPYSPDGKTIVEEHTEKINKYFVAGTGEEWKQISRKEYLGRKDHKVKLQSNHIVIDFDLKGEDGEKSLEKNLQDANEEGTPLKKWENVETKLSDIDTSKLH